MDPRAIEYEVGDGVLAALDFGGRGTPVLLVHGSGHNANAWGDVAHYLTPHCRVLAIDLRGHGQTPLQSANAEQYWRDLGPVCQLLGAAVLVGHSSGGYAVCAATVADRVEPLALCVVDGVVLDDRAAAVSQSAAWSTPQTRAMLQETMRYGWVADDEEATAYIDDCARHAATDALNAGARPALVRDVMRRAFMRRDGQWVRRPSLEEIAVVSSPDPAAAIYPSVDLYNSLGCPITFVQASRGFYAARRGALNTIVAARANRRCVDIDANHNVPMTRPEVLAHIILDVVRSA